jgi:hypothetical protein
MRITPITYLSNSAVSGQINELKNLPPYISVASGPIALPEGTCNPLRPIMSQLNLQPTPPVVAKQVGVSLSWFLKPTRLILQHLTTNHQSTRPCLHGQMFPLEFANLFPQIITIISTHVNTTT